MADLKTVHLNLPASTADMRALEIGSVAYLTGRVFTAREGVYKRAVEDGVGMPAPREALGLVNFHCSPAAAVNADGSHTVGAVTATASFRFAKWLDGWFALSGCNIIIGKGGMTSEIYRKSFVPNGAIYLTTVGYGTGALLGRGIKRVAGVYWLEELGLVNFHCSPAAAVNADGSHTVGAVTATASFRFAKWLDGWFALSGCNIIIGKGGMTSDIYRKSFVPNGAIYLTTVGYGTGALLGRGIKRVAGVYWLEELGLAQAVWVLEVENFGPFLVESDLEGNSLFERENAKIAPGIERLYQGTRPAIMRRYGETDDKTEELI